MGREYSDGCQTLSQSFRALNWPGKAAFVADRHDSMLKKSAMHQVRALIFPIRSTMMQKQRSSHASA
jgi:hypothetical protein